MSADAVRFVFRRPFQRREFLEQCWFIARVALAPTLLVAIPFTVLISFTLNILLRELGAADLSGAGAAFGAVTQIGPIVTVLIVAGAGSTAICADLGSRTIREEIDAMEVLGIDPVQRLVTPRMLASGLVALLLNSLVVIIGRLLSRPNDHRRWRQGGRQRGERNRGVCLYVAVRGQRSSDRHRHPNDGAISDGLYDDPSQHIPPADTAGWPAGGGAVAHRRPRALLLKSNRRYAACSRALPPRNRPADR
jgi:hypothetical protein